MLNTTSWWVITIALVVPEYRIVRRSRNFCTPGCLPQSINTLCKFSFAQASRYVMLHSQAQFQQQRIIIASRSPSRVLLGHDANFGPATTLALMTRCVMTTTTNCFGNTIYNIGSYNSTQFRARSINFRNDIPSDIIGPTEFSNNSVLQLVYRDI